MFGLFIKKKEKYLFENLISPTEEEIKNACLSYRHDFGLLSKEKQDETKNQAIFWLSAWRKTVCKENKPEVKIEKTWQDKAIEDLVEFREIGEKLNFLGVEMIVVGHCKWAFDKKFPCLLVNYVDKNGRIRSGSFEYRELEALKKENPR